MMNSSFLYRARPPCGAPPRQSPVYTDEGKRGGYAGFGDSYADSVCHYRREMRDFLISDDRSGINFRSLSGCKSIYVKFFYPLGFCDVFLQHDMADGNRFSEPNVDCRRLGPVGRFEIVLRIKGQTAVMADVFYQMNAIVGIRLECGGLCQIHGKGSFSGTRRFPGGGAHRFRGTVRAGRAGY